MLGIPPLTSWKQVVVLNIVIQKEFYDFIVTAFIEYPSLLIVKILSFYVYLTIFHSFCTFVWKPISNITENVFSYVVITT